MLQLKYRLHASIRKIRNAFSSIKSHMNSNSTHCEIETRKLIIFTPFIQRLLILGDTAANIMCQSCISNKWIDLTCFCYSYSCIKSHLVLRHNAKYIVNHEASEDIRKWYIFLMLIIGLDDLYQRCFIVDTNNPESWLEMTKKSFFDFEFLIHIYPFWIRNIFFSLKNVETWKIYFE